MSTASSPKTPVHYAPYDDGTQLARYINQYPRSFTRNPSQPLIERPVTLSELSGPTDLARRFEVGQTDLSHAVPGGPRALGQLITVSGRVTDEEGRPLSGAVMELWQANSCGKYVHKLDRYEAPLDPNFIGQCRIATGQEGEFQFVTVKPGAYPVLESEWWWRPPHIHFSIFGPSWMNRYVTQIFFPGEPLNKTDLLLNGVADEESRERLIFQTSEPFIDRRKALGFKLDFVLRGKRATPALD